MLLETTQPDCCKEFAYVTDFIDRMFKYAQNPRNRPFNETNFKEYFGNEGKWFWSLSDSDNGPVRKGYLALFQLSTLEVARLRRAVTNDLLFYSKADDRRFIFHAQSLPNNLLQRLKDFIEPFYSNIFCKSGFKDILGLKTTGLNRDLYLKQYKQTNLDRYNVCPACLGAVQGYYETLLAENEHYFPKKAYPSLGFCEYNLIPICSDCNSPKIHGSKDPIISHAAGAISKVFLPYIRVGMDSITLTFNRTVGGFRVTINPTNTHDPNLVERVASIKEIYQLEERWSDRITIHFGDLVAVLKAHKPTNNDTKPWLLDYLQKHAIGRAARKYNSADAFLETSFYKYLSEQYVDRLVEQL